MKTYILSAEVGTGGVTADTFVKQDGSGGVIDNDTAGSEVGVANATKTVGQNVGVIKSGLMKLNAVAGTYNFGDALEVATGGLNLTALGTGTQVATVAEESQKVLSATGELLVLLNIK